MPPLGKIEAQAFQFRQRDFEERETNLNNGVSAQKNH
jgi:hypothetical protein